jgi:hypothetical protein
VSPFWAILISSLACAAARQDVFNYIEMIYVLGYRLPMAAKGVALDLAHAQAYELIKPLLDAVDAGEMICPSKFQSGWIF